MRTHRDGYIQANRVSILISAAEMRKGESSGITRIEGMKQMIRDCYGIEIEDSETICGIPLPDGGYEVRFSSSWQRPSRR